MGDTLASTGDHYTVIELSPEDRYELVKLAADVRVKTEELAMVRVRLDAARAVSDAAGDAIAAKIGVPKDAQEVTIDLNAGIIRYLTPENV